MGIYIGDKRYGFCISKSNLIKTVTLDSSHEEDSIGNAVYWSTFLEIPVVTDKTDRNLYLCVFENNNAATANYKVDFLLYYINGNNGVSCAYIRNNRKTYGNNMADAISLHASINTVINVYKIPSI